MRSTGWPGDSVGGVRLWDPVTGRLIRALRNSQTNEQNAPVFSPDGKLLATANADGTVQL